MTPSTIIQSGFDLLEFIEDMGYESTTHPELHSAIENLWARSGDPA